MLALLTETEQEKVYKGYDVEQMEALLYDWNFWARPSQQTPEQDFFVWLILAGRGYGKTRVACEQLLKWKREGYKRFAIVAQTPAEARDVIIEGESGLLSISPLWDMPVYEPSKRRVTWGSGTTAIIYSGENPEQLRGAQQEKAIVDELAKYKYPQETWDNLLLGTRIGDNPQIVIATTPKPIKTLKEIISQPDTIITKGSTYENRSNLAEKFFATVVRKYEGTRLGRQELHAEILDDNPSALWHSDIIEKYRVDKAPELVRIIVAIDPATTDDENSDEAGIVVAGVDMRGHGYILEDVSLKASPDKWAQKAVYVYNKWEADRIIGEANNGGDMIEIIIRQHEKHVAYSKVWASRGKYIRAEPVAALYEQGKVHHVEMYPELEDELCDWEPGDKSPNRLDALVWAITDLMLPKKGKLKVKVK